MWVVVQYLGSGLFLEVKRGIKWTELPDGSHGLLSTFPDGERDESSWNGKIRDIDPHYRISHLDDLKDRIQLTDNAIEELQK